MQAVPTVVCRQAGVNFEFEAIIGSVLGGTSMAGGIGNVAMSIVGIYVVGIINNVMNLCSVNAFWQQVVRVSLF